MRCVICSICLNIIRPCNACTGVRRWLASRPCSDYGLTPPTSSSSWSLARPWALASSAPRAAPSCSLRRAKCELPRSALLRLGKRLLLPKPLAQAAPRPPRVSSLRSSGHMWWRHALTTSAAPWTAPTDGATSRSDCSGLTRSAPSKAGRRRAHIRCVLRTRCLAYAADAHLHGVPGRALLIRGVASRRSADKRLVAGCSAIGVCTGWQCRRPGA